MIAKIKYWLETQRLRRAAEKYMRGYNWAAGSLILGKETPMSIEAQVYEPMRNEFDDGAKDASDKLILLGVVEDDRI
jgi:hypothetical protein